MNVHLRASARAYPLLAALILGGALALRWQCLHTGFMVDDYLQLAMVEGVYPVDRSAVELFTFATGERAQNEVLRQTGLLTWWSHPELKVSMFRPLSCALMWLDHALFGLHAFSYHLHCAGWWLLMGAALAALLRRLLPAWVALLALLLFAIDEAHNPLLNWIALRNALVASTFALVGLFAQVRERQDGWRAGPYVALGSYTLALAAGEYALAFAGYALLYEFQQPMPREQRLRRLAMPALLLLGYFGLRFAFGAGTSGSAQYLHPLSAPLEFARLGALRYALLATELVFALPSGYWTWGVIWPIGWVEAGWIPQPWLLDMTGPRQLHGALAIGCTVLAGWIVLAGLRAARTAGLDSVRWLILGAPLAIVPMVSAFADSRLVLPALLGWSVVPAVLLHAGLRDLRGGPWRARGLAAAAAAAALVVFHVAMPTSHARRDAQMELDLGVPGRRALLDGALDPLLGPGKRVLLIGAADPTTSVYGALVRKVHGRSAPSQWHMLSSTVMHQRFERLTASSFVLERLYTGYTPGDTYAEFFTDQPLRVGHRYRAGDLQVTVERVHQGRPIRTRYELGAPLEHPSFVFLTQSRLGLRPLALPPVGASAILEPPAPPIDVR